MLKNMFMGGVIQNADFQHFNTQKRSYFTFRNVSKERKEKERLPYFENMSYLCR